MIMEQLLAFCIVILPIAYGIGCLGRKRKIGFWWAFALSAANIIFGLIVTLCSKKPNQFFNVDGNDKQKKSSFLIWGYVILVFGWIYFLNGTIRLLHSVRPIGRPVYTFSFISKAFIDDIFLYTVLPIAMIMLGKFLTKNKSPKYDKQKSKVLGMVIFSASTILLIVLTPISYEDLSLLQILSFFIIFGAYLIHRAKQRVIEENDKSQWNNDLSSHN